MTAARAPQFPHNNTWTASRLERALQLRAANCTLEVIASDLGGVSLSAVYNKFRRLQTPPRIREDLWPDDRIEQLKLLLAERISATEMARRIGVTRNAVIGKLHRMGLQSQPIINQPRRYIRKPTTCKTKPLRPTEPPAAPPIFEEPLNLALADLELDQCHWITSDKKPPLYCGRPTPPRSGIKPRSPYCPFHTKLSRAGS